MYVLYKKNQKYIVFFLLRISYINYINYIENFTVKKKKKKLTYEFQLKCTSLLTHDILYIIYNEWKNKGL